MSDEFDADDVGEHGFHASGDYSRVREQLRYWPYTTYRIEDTLDIGLIEGKGRQLLFQAINARNLTAFVGSGMSAAYGRLTWSNWQKEQFRVVQEGAERFETLKDHSVRLLQALAEVADPGARPDGPVNEFTALRDRLWTEHDQSTRYNLWRWFGFRRRQVEDAWHRIEGLRATFERSKDGAGFPGGEELPLKFQIAQQLHDQLRSHIRIFMPPAHKRPYRDEVLKNGWPGARIDDESSPPRKGLVRLHESLKEETTPKLEQLREDYTAALSAFCDTFSRPEARVEAQELAKMLLFDERAHSVITLREGLLGGDARGGTNEELRRRYDELERALKIFDMERLKRDIDGIRDDPDLYRVLGAYQFETLSKLRNKLAAENPARAALWEGFREFEKTRIDEYRERIKPAGDERRFITPSSRFIVAVYLRLLDRPFDMIGPEPGPDLPEKSPLFPELERSDFTSRRSIIANRFDPLAKTVRQLGITRYITTNYDVEIERFFQDMGYRKFPKVRDASVPAGAIRPPEDDEYRSDPIGGLLLDQTFNRENASDLVAFSVGDQRKDAAVFHLHGRATAKDDLVITERDYMNLYLLEDEHRDTVNEAITMAFSSAPLVFLGLGMNEADLLRPLRQFMSNRDRTIGYQALAILPGEEQVEKRTKFAVTCFLRYGVHTIFYGSGQIEKFDGGKEPLSIDWLCRILELNKAMGAALDTLEETGERKAPDALLAELAKKVGFTNDGLSEDSDNHIALMALFGKGAKQAHSAKPDVITPKVFAPVAADIMDGKLKLRVCSFTPIRPDRKSRESRHFDPDVFIEGDEFVGFATGLMNQSLRILLHLHDAPDSEGNARDIAALRMSLSGLYGALLTGALNAQLVGLEKEWRSWWQKWQQSPPHRFARFEHLPITAKDPLPFHPARFIRHRVSSIITETDRLEKAVCTEMPIGPAPEDSQRETEIREEFRTNVRAFDTFIHAVHDAVALKGHLDPDRRLLLTVAAYRGLGKGSFLSAMSSTLGLSLYEQATWGSTGTGTDRPFIMAALFINLSFSTEIASCFDSLRCALMEMVAALTVAHSDLEAGMSAQDVRSRLEASINRGEPGKDRPYHYETGGKEAFEALEVRFTGVSRMETIRGLFQSFKELSEDSYQHSNAFGRPRMMVYLSGLELVYDRKGKPKNAELKGLLDLIFNNGSAGVPADFLFIGSEHGLGYPFSQKFGAGRKVLQQSISAGDPPTRAREQIDERQRNGNLSIDTPKRIEEERKADPAPCINHVHFARPVRPTSLLHDNFQTLALGLYINSPPALAKGREGHEVAAKKALKKLADKFREAVPQGRENSDKAMHKAWSAATLPRITKLDANRKAVWQHVKQECTDLLREHAEIITGRDLSGVEAEEILRYRLSDSYSADREEWRRIRRRVGNNRFITTLLLALMDFLIVHAGDVVDGAKETEEFLRSTIDQVRNAGQQRLEEVVLKIVLDRYRRHHQIGHPDLDLELHQMVLRHLGLIGCPVSSAVLVRLPEFRDYFRRIGIDLPYSRRRFLTRALTVLAYRGLIFRLDPHPRLVTLAERRKQQQLEEEDRDWPASEVYRYALHRTVQAYAIAKMGVGKIDPVRTNSFAPRLYVSMPSIGTGLSFESYQFIRSLLIGLSQYPDIHSEDTDLVPWLFTSNTRSVRAQALRAALSMARSTVSVATLSRFPAHADRDEALKPRPVGLMENYKFRLRWIIRMAWELVDKKDEEKAKENRNGEFDFLQPLYRDEIVWLYNELGVVALAQGNLTEALGFLRQAAEFNEEIEGRSRYGPIFDYIDLNHAIVQLERGRLESADQRLKRIKERHDTDQEGALWNFAEGYLCVLDHIRGAYVGLNKRYETVIANLQKLNDMRAVAIFMSHHARFKAAQPQNDVLPSLDVATALAETEGHEDIRHHIEISRLTINYRASVAGRMQLDNRDALRQLLDIELYGRRMGIWNLQVDALRLRAEILLSEGETSSAGMLLVRAMAIAKRFRMTLRLTGSLTVYAKLLQARGDLKGAERHALIALEMSKEIGYSLQTSLAQRILAKIDPAKY